MDIQSCDWIIISAHAGMPEDPKSQHTSDRQPHFRRDTTLCRCVRHASSYPLLTKKAMDPISVLSVASSLIQVVDISARLISVYRHGGSLGRNSDNTRILMLIEQLQRTVTLIDIVRGPTIGIGLNETRIEILDLANELLALSNKIDRANNAPLWRLPTASLRLASTGKQIESIHYRFDLLHDRIVSSM